MRIRKTGWAVWDKGTQKFITRNNMLVFSDKTTAWLVAGKERKDSPHKVIRINLSIKK